MYLANSTLLPLVVAFLELEALPGVVLVADSVGLLCVLDWVLVAVVGFWGLLKNKNQIPATAAKSPIGVKIANNLPDGLFL